MNIKLKAKNEEKVNRSPRTTALHVPDCPSTAPAKQFVKVLEKIRQKPTREELAEKATNPEEWNTIAKKLAALASASKKTRLKRKTESLLRLAPDQPLSDAELREIRAIVEGDECPDPRAGRASSWINDRPSQSGYGQIAPFPEAQLLVWMDTVMTGLINAEINPDNAAEPPSQFKHHVFDWIADMVMENDSGFFARLSFLLAARKKGRRMVDISPKELGYRRSRGRKPKPYDLECCAKSAILEVLAYRVCRFPDEGELGLREFRITRDELQHVIRKTRLEAGMKNPPKVSNFELSRWIMRTDIRRFMADC